MPKYEIMLIVDPKQLTEAEKLAKEVLGSEANITKLEKTELAYEINRTKVANYLVIDVTTTGAVVKEFVRRANISKAIWRHLAINIDSERARDTINAEPKRPFMKREDQAERRPFVKKPYIKRDVTETTR